MPEWLLKLSRRLQALTPGRYVIILTIGKQPNWQVAKCVKTEIE